MVKCENKYKYMRIQADRIVSKKRGKKYKKISKL